MKELSALIKINFCGRRKKHFLTNSMEQKVFLTIQRVLRNFLISIIDFDTYTTFVDHTQL